MVDVVGIVGRAYSGSTMLNCLLGAHSEAFAASELYRAAERPNITCRNCGENCAVWTQELLAGARADPLSIYSDLSLSTGASVIVDASKRPLQFTSMQQAKDLQRYVLIVLSKHPARHFASYITNEVLGKSRPKATLEDFAFYLADESDEAHRIIDELIENFFEYESRKMRLLEKLDHPNSIVLPLKYEDIVADPTKALTTILHQVSRTFEPSQLDWTNTTFHPLGGNTGALVKAGVSLPMKKVKRAYYKQAEESIFLDDKYQELFNPDLKRYIREHDGYKRLLDVLEYSDIL